MKTILIFLVIAIIGTLAGAGAGWMFAKFGGAFGCGLLALILVTILVIDGVCHDRA